MRAALLVFVLAAALGPGGARGAEEGFPAEALRALPPDANAVLHLRVARLRGCQALRGFPLADILGRLAEGLTLDWTQVDELLLGGRADQEPVILVRFHQPPDEAALMIACGATAAQPAGNLRVYEVDEAELTLAFLDPRILLLAPGFEGYGEAQAALARLQAAGEPCALAREALALDADAAIVFGAQDLELPAVGANPPAAARLVRAQATLRAGSSLNLEAQATLADPAQAEALAAAARALQERLRAQLAEMPAEPDRDPPQLAALERLQLRTREAAVSARTTAGAPDLALLRRLLGDAPGNAPRSANEAAAIATLRTILTAEFQFRTERRDARYGSLADLSGGTPPFVVEAVGRGTQAGYTFVLNVAPDGQSFQCRAGPAERGRTGSRYFYVDNSNVVRQGNGPDVDGNSAPID